MILCLADTSFGQASIRVDEAATRIHIQRNADLLELVITLPVENPNPQNMPAHVSIELVDTHGTVRTHVEKDVSLRPSLTTLKIPLPPLRNSGEGYIGNELFWFRLRYLISPEPGGGIPAKPAEGLVSVGEITPQLFDLHVAGPPTVKEGGHYTFRVRAIHPLTGRPVADVTVQASLDVDTDSSKPLLTHKSETNREGFAALAFTLPNALDSEDNEGIDVKVTGTLGPFSEEAEGELRFGRSSFSSLSTDKSLYQPGQTLHMRLMAFDGDKMAIANQPLVLSISDPEDTLQYRADTQTSRFGIAALDWKIPENIRLGTYQIRSEFQADRYQYAAARAAVKISRYELPTFTVIATPDRSYYLYLPGQNASVEIRADYLFGKPVRHGHVRVVREAEREWNYREQRWDVKEEETYQGDTDDQGRYVAKVNLTRDHEQLEQEDYQRFRDLHFAAYFTDASTNRTEQRRFDIRATKEDIHIYVIGNASVPQGLPLNFYISTDYADGSPASCAVQITWEAGSPPKNAGSPLPLEQPLRRVQTNRYGVAKVSGVGVPSEPERSTAYLSFRADDRKGGVGHHTESLWYSDAPGLYITTDKTLYRPGDPIEVTVTASKPDLTVFLEAVQGSQVLNSQRIRVRGGHASLVLPPSEEFQDEVSLLAYGFGLYRSEYGLEQAIVSSHTVLFPENHELKLDVRPQKSTYRPADEATVNFHVAGPDGGALQSALGLVVVDKALEERQRTEEEFGEATGFWGFRQSRRVTQNLSGVRRSDLDKLDPTKPLPAGLELVAEILLQDTGVSPEFFSSEASKEDLHTLFSSEIDPEFEPIVHTLSAHYEDTGEYPTTGLEFRRYLADAGRHFEGLTDPWGRPYKVDFAVQGAMDLLVVKSAGPDKKFGTDDDFEVARMNWPYFKSRADTLQHTLEAFHAQTGGYIRDEQALRVELGRHGIDIDSWRDPWGHPYRFTFGVATTQFTVAVTSAGPDGRFSTEAEPSYDDIPLARIGIDYTTEMAGQFDAALTRYFKEREKFPQSNDELQKVFQESGLVWDSFKDPWGHGYYATFHQEAKYADRMAVERYQDHERGNFQRLVNVPVTRQINWVYIRSAGEDGIEGTQDDFNVAIFSRAFVEQASQEKTPQALHDQAVLAGATGAISGTVTDASGAVIPGAKAAAKSTRTDQSYNAVTDSSGKYLLRNLPADFYYVEVSAPGFQKYGITEVPVRSSSITRLDVTLQVGAVTQTVEVRAAPAMMQTESAMLSGVTQSGAARTSLTQQLSTPHLRQYFPETLLWQPELVTDDKGHAHVTFPLADSITTWKLSAVASTVDGRLGTAEKEIRAFQPFFIEHDPPRFLTSGDEIALPVVLRNYLTHPLQATVAMEPESWFTLANPGPKTVEIAPGDSAGEVFPFKAVTPAKQGKQKVTALSGEASDAIERTVTVRPDGKEETQTFSQVFREKASLDLEIPAASLPGSLEATLKVYPNLNAHVLESIEAIMVRPHGCAEQTISSAYPSILYLRYAKDAKQQASTLSQRARKYVQLGYERLLSYRAPEGGFTYWGRGEADLALTAYAIKFLADAGEFMTVDEQVFQKAVTWLADQAQPDGHWIERKWGGGENPRRSLLVTAYIARMIAASQVTTRSDSTQSNLVAQKASKALNNAMNFLAPSVAPSEEPYLLADYALAALAAGDEGRARGVLNRLRQLEHREGESGYWALEMNTPFYGWGTAGRVETTALVLQAFEKEPSALRHTQESDELISRGMLFLLRNQDCYGVWYTTQATVDVLDAIVALTASEEERSAAASTLFKAEIFVDGKAVASLNFPPANKISGPLTQDLSLVLAPGSHRIEIRRPTGKSAASLQLVADYYLPWDHEGAQTEPPNAHIVSDALRLAVHFDKNSLQHGEDVQCTVLAERVGFRGYGMLLAEIGLPPGAEVDRGSLERAMKASDWAISQYDILPDRMVVYLWPHAGGVKFSFTFKPRFGLRALSTPSLLYDYYNPEARAVVEPTLFIVQ